MPNQKTIFLLLIIFSVTFGFTSCLVRSHHDNGYHRGHYKNHQYTRKVYVERPAHHETYQLAPVYKVHKEKKHSKKHTWNAKK
ncbi:MAG: hypothetical protein AUK44_09780 [Porphyromonadaceae bacterium CG2_30_38_12]|nr:MAG: hypothetical protein AUK44_09780 [Porphyromonadaceae bacterium CG2_30_38_12]